MATSYLSYSAAAILHALKNGHHYGFDIMDALGLPSGTVYPALRRMEESGFIASKWEKAQIAQREARPPRKYYELTRSGRTALTDAAERYRLPEDLETRAARPVRARSEA
jgi:DNA-binding PadR family transcriptional regulator